MREIKFRGKRKDIGWKYGYLTIIEKAHEPNLTAIKPFDEKWITYGVDPESVGEYTGLKDKNGKEGYHKDIVRRMDDLYIIEWHDNLASWFLEPLCGGWHGISKGDMALMCEVIGNPYENPELLE